jgi:hypothetical protein
MPGMSTEADVSRPSTAYMVKLFPVQGGWGVGLMGPANRAGVLPKSAGMAEARQIAEALKQPLFVICDSHGRIMETVRLEAPAVTQPEAPAESGPVSN